MGQRNHKYAFILFYSTNNELLLFPANRVKKQVTWVDFENTIVFGSLSLVLYSDPEKRAI